MTTRAILIQIDKAIEGLTEDQKQAIDLMKKNNLKKASETVGYRENTGALLYELKLQLLSEIDKASSNVSAEKRKMIQKFQEFAGRKPKHPSWKYAYYSEEDKQYLLLCDYFMIVTSNPGGLELIGNPLDYKQIDWKKYNNMEYETTVPLPNVKALDLYIQQQKETLPDKGKVSGIRYIFPNGMVMNAEWLLWAMKLTGSDKLYYIGNRKPCQIRSSEYRVTLMPAMPVGKYDEKPTELPKISGAKKLF